MTSTHTPEPNIIENDPHTANETQANTAKTSFDWKALIVVALIIIFIREISVWLMTLVGYANLGNLVGLFILLGFALTYRHFKGDIPARIVTANSKILKEGIFAFLPICAGGGILVSNLGHDTFKILLIMCISTLIPMWIYAHLVKKWL